MSVAIRNFHPSDMAAVYRICLLTGDSGQDASHIYRDPDILGHFYAAPYAVYEPDLCLIATMNGQPVGYILGTADTARFNERCETDWFPVLRNRYTLPDEHDMSPDARIIRLIHQGYIYKPELHSFQAHLHIDLLPAAQGQGFGKKLIFLFADELRQQGVKALHLEVGKRNIAAVAFYERVGFQRIYDYEYSIAFGMEL